MGSLVVMLLAGAIVLMPFIIIGVVVLVIVLAVFGAKQAAKRRKELTLWAQARGLRFDESKDGSYDNHHPNFEALRSGSNRYAYNVISGQIDGRAVECFDYHYETQSRNKDGNTTTHHHHFSAAIVALDLPFTPLFIRPEGFFDKVKAFFGVEDIDFELDAFSRAFYVKCKDKRFAYDVIQPETMELLLASPRFTMDFERTHVLLYTGKIFEPLQFDAAVTLVGKMLANMPDYVHEERKAVSHDV